MIKFLYNQLKLGIKEFWAFSLVETMAIAILLVLNYFILNLFNIDLFELIDTNIYLFGLIAIINIGLIIFVYRFFSKK